MYMLLVVFGCSHPLATVKPISVPARSHLHC